MTIVLNAEDVQRATNMRVLVDAIEKGLREEALGQVVMPPRLNLPLKAAGTWFRIMPAVMNESGLMGFKAFQRAASGVRYLIAVYEQEEGNLLALMDAAYLTAARTGAATGLATKYLAPPGATHVAVIGSGLEARTNLEAVCAVKPVKRVTVYSPRQERREAFAAWVRTELGVEATAVESPERCLAEAEIVVVATVTAGQPDPISYRGAWMQPGIHVNSIGSTMPVQREIDPEAFARSDRIVVDAGGQIEEESGDVIAAIREGTYDRTRVVELKDVVAGKVKGRTKDNEITLYKSVGTAVQDVMAGFAVYEEARRLSLGQDIGDLLELKTRG